MNTIPNPIKAATAQRYADRLDLLRYAQEHLRQLEHDLFVGMAFTDECYCVMSIQRAIARLNELQHDLLDHEGRR